MPWKFPINFIGASRETHVTTRRENIAIQPCYPPSTSTSSSCPSTSTSSGDSEQKRPSDQPHSPLYRQISPTEEAIIIACLEDKSITELNNFLTDKGAYGCFLNSLEQMRIQNNILDELREETLQLAMKNLEKDTHLSELRNQCTIIRTTDLAAVQEKLTELERQKEDLMRGFSLSSLLQKLQGAVDKAEEESEELQSRFLEKEIDLSNFVHKYMQLRTLHHRRSLLHLAAKSST